MRLGGPRASHPGDVGPCSEDRHLCWAKRQPFSGVIGTALPPGLHCTLYVFLDVLAEEEVGKTLPVFKNWLDLIILHQSLQLSLLFGGHAAFGLVLLLTRRTIPRLLDFLYHGI